MFLIYISLVALFTILFFLVTLFFKKSPIIKQNRRLALVFLTLGMYDLFSLYYYYVITSHSQFLLSHYYPLNLIWALLIGPSMYFCTRYSFGYADSIRRWKTWLHALPVILVIAYCCYFATLPVAQRITISITNFENLTTIERLINIMFYVQILSYHIYIFGLIYFKRQQHNESNDGQWMKPLNWLSFILFLSLFFICIRYNKGYYNVLAIIALADIEVLYFFIKSIFITGLFVQKTVTIEVPEIKQEMPEEKKEPLLKIKDEMKESYLEILLNKMETEKLYLNEDCSLETISSAFNIPRHHLSNILNTDLKKSFNDFINEYRIKHACLLLTDIQKKDITIEAIGFECGFNSRSCFYRAFKTHTGHTPKEYIKTFQEQQTV